MLLKDKYPASIPCSCEICQTYCKRPGWWTVEEAENAISKGIANRMMLEIAPEMTFGILSPAFRGNEANIALKIFARNGCTFHKNGLCELFGKGLQPLECRFCHHDRKGLGKKCHSDIEKDWKSIKAKKLIVEWGTITGLWARQGCVLKLKE